MRRRWPPLDPAIGSRLVRLIRPLRVPDMRPRLDPGQLRLSFGDQPFAHPDGPMLWLNDGSDSISYGRRIHKTVRAGSAIASKLSPACG